ncbi:unnamed protein product [Kuraishia capsulata CBS 1993]|uniref:Uncharacterized protein n=1 Tax=Kuraishia capsulata CBS 1993 TaxID=1382522 RepID=W6MJN1_9ASCO|nr:uncharacterized protein KUCA_T00000643001 [Kuraishia capsulata CBS 1993]CDK24677.1 unnamed protein product [Kuraishia capsulata CBS 1993]
MSFLDRWLSRTQQGHHTGSNMVNTGATYSTRRLSTKSTGAGVEYVVEDVKTSPNLLNTPVAYYKQVAKGTVKPAANGKVDVTDILKQVENDVGPGKISNDLDDLKRLDQNDFNRKGSVVSEASDY